MQLAKHLGLKVFATAGTDAGMSIVKECGADFTYNHKDADYTDRILVSVYCECFIRCTKHVDMFRFIII